MFINFRAARRGPSLIPRCARAGRRGLHSYLDVLGGELERRVGVVGVRVAVHEQLVTGGRSGPVQLAEAAPRLPSNTPGHLSAQQGWVLTMKPG